MDVHGNVFPALEKSLDRTSVTFVLSAVGPVEYSTCLSKWNLQAFIISISILAKIVSHASKALRR